ncbi:MAG: 30S ribosomal protein S4, partial [Spirochaetaceae bacterium]
LERRLDNVVYRLGLAASRSQARQLVSHGHIHLNGRKVTVPSALVRASDVVASREKKATKDLLRRLLAENTGRPVPPWLSLERDGLVGTVTVLPTRDVIPTIAEEQLVVEFYSK